MLLLLAITTSGLADDSGVFSVGEHTYRDVITTCFRRPFMTDANLQVHFTDTRGRVASAGRPVRFHYPGVQQVVVGGRPLPVIRSGPNLLQVALPAGVHDVEIVASPDAASMDLPKGAGGKAHAVASLDQFNNRAKALGPGEELVVANGVYAGWASAVIVGEGTADRPAVVRPETPGGVVFRRRTHIRIRGKHVVFKGFRFDHAGPAHVLYLSDGEHLRVTQCQFSFCGNPQSTFSHIVRLARHCNRSRVDHCFFAGSKSMSIGLRIHGPDDVGTDNRFDHNIFRDIYRYWGNGQENIQLGGPSRGAMGEVVPRTTVEHCLFDNAWGDSEIISNKSSGNVIRHNLATHCLFAAFTLRGGNDVRFEGNVVVNCAGGVRVYGKRHVVANNLFVDLRGVGVFLHAGSRDGRLRVAAEDTLITHNTFVNCPAPPIASGGANATDPFPVRNTRAIDNRVTSSRGTLSDIAAERRRLDMLPEVPPWPLMMPDMHKGDVAFTVVPRGHDAEFELADSELPATGDLPADFVMQWEYLPKTWASQASVRLSADRRGNGYTIAWGGVDAAGRPLGVISLCKGESTETLADGPDIVHHRMSYPKPPKPGTRPPEKWYAFTLIKHGRRIWLALRPARRFTEVPAIPVLVWQDTGPVPVGTRLRIRQQGAGVWRRVSVWRFSRAPRLAPPAPTAMVGRRWGGARVALRWQRGHGGGTPCTYEVHRGTRPGFTPSTNTRIATRAGGLGYDDFHVKAGVTYTYKLRARNALGLMSRFVDARVAVGTDGPWYLYMKATSAKTIEEPLTIRQDPATGEAFLDVPPSGGSPIEGPIDQGLAVYEFAAPRKGVYGLWGLARGDDGSSDSFYMALDAKPLASYFGWSVPISDTWTWRRIRRVTLSAGTHLLRIKHRETGAKLKAILVTDDLRYKPPSR